MYTAINPYTSILLTYNSHSFYGRESEVINILQVVTAPEPNGHAIYGLRTMGKTTLFRYLKDPNGAQSRYESYMHPDYQIGGSKRLMFVYIDFHTFRADDVVFREMLSHLLDTLQDSAPDVQLYIRRPGAEESKQALCDILKDALNELQGVGIRAVFLFDDFDAALEHIKVEDDRLLRSITDFAPLIIATEKPISELRPDIGNDSPLLGILRPQGVQLLSESAARRLIMEPAQATGQSLNADEVEFLLEIGGTQPFVLIATCEAYYNLRLEHQDVVNVLTKPDERELFRRRFILRLAQAPHMDTVFRVIWKKISPEEQAALVRLTQGTPALDNDPLGRGGVIGRLENKGLVVPDIYGLGQPRIFSPVFEEFVRRDAQAGDGATLTATPSPALHISGEKLTPIDRAVLNYLLAHVNQTCTFEEIIGAVWQDEDALKYKRGLEAAVYRLRNALGDHPAIENVRGVGYKLVN